MTRDSSVRESANETLPSRPSDLHFASAELPQETVLQGLEEGGGGGGGGRRRGKKTKHKNKTDQKNLCLRMSHCSQ